MEQINFHFDPICPWAWLTSRWMVRLEELGEAQVEWRLFSLGIVHLEDGQDPADGPVGDSGPALQLLALARREGGNAMVSRLYTALGDTAHKRGEKLSERSVLDIALADAGMDPKGATAALEDHSLWLQVVAEHEAATKSCQAFGVPTVILDAGAGPGVFGPVITKVPSDEECVGLLNDMVRMMRRDYFFEPCVCLFEYEDPALLGVMDVSYAPNMWMRSSYYGADEFFEIQGDEGLIWVTRATGEMLDLAPVMLYNGKQGECGTTEIRDVDADWGSGFKRSSAHFVESLVAGTPAAMTVDEAVKVLQLCFAVYRSADERVPVDPASVTGFVVPSGWPGGPEPAGG